MSLRKIKGFTLIELLVVIAVIGILAGLMFPAIGGVIERAQAVQIANKGKNIVTMIVSANLSREANSDTSLWPDRGNVLSKNSSGELGPEWTGVKSSDYFDALLRGGPSDDGYIEGLNPQLFAGAGVPMARAGAALNESNNVWRVIAHIGNPEGDPPFMLTRNNLPNAFAGSETEWKVSWKEDEKPFGRNRVIVVSRGSSVNTIARRDVTWDRFGFGVSLTNLTGAVTLEP